MSDDSFEGADPNDPLATGLEIVGVKADGTPLAGAELEFREGSDLPYVDALRAVGDGRAQLEYLGKLSRELVGGWRTTGARGRPRPTKLDAEGRAVVCTRLPCALTVIVRHDGVAAKREIILKPGARQTLEFRAGVGSSRDEASQKLIDELLSDVGIGEALVASLDQIDRPTPERASSPATQTLTHRSRGRATDSLRVRVLDAVTGAPIQAHARIAGELARIVTGDGGFVSVEVQPAVESIELRGAGHWPKDVHRRATPNGSTVSLDPIFASGDASAPATLAIRARDRNGEALAYGALFIDLVRPKTNSAIQLGGRQFDGYERLDRQGRLAMQRFAVGPGERWVGRAAISKRADSGTFEFTLEPGRSCVLDVTLDDSTRQGAGACRGRLRFAATGAPCAGATMQLVRLEFGAAKVAARTVVSDRDGVFAFSDLEPGARYRVETASGLVGAIATFEAPDRGEIALTMDVVPLRRLRLEIVEAGTGAPLVDHGVGEFVWVPCGQLAEFQVSPREHETVTVRVDDGAPVYPDLRVAVPPR